jgi:hypothetical protein
MITNNNCFYLTYNRTLLISFIEEVMLVHILIKQGFLYLKGKIAIRTLLPLLEQDTSMLLPLLIPVTMKAVIQMKQLQNHMELMYMSVPMATRTVMVPLRILFRLFNKE